MLHKTKLKSEIKHKHEGIPYLIIILKYNNTDKKITEHSLSSRQMHIFPELTMSQEM